MGERRFEVEAGVVAGATGSRAFFTRFEVEAGWRRSAAERSDFTPC